MRVTEFLVGRDVERQAVTKYISRHEELFEGHTKKVGKEIDLDEVAVEELEKVYPLAKPMTIVTGVPHEEYIKIQNELINAQKIVCDLQSRLAECQSATAAAQAAEMLLEAKSQQLSDLEEKSQELQGENKTLQEENKRLLVELERERSKTWFQKLFRKRSE